VKHGIYFFGNEDKVRYVMADERKILVGSQMCQILRISGDEIIHPDHFMAFPQKPIAKMTAQKTRRACN
jgi:hypothetical protein